MAPEQPDPSPVSDDDVPEDDNPDNADSPRNTGDDAARRKRNRDNNDD